MKATLSDAITEYAKFRASCQMSRGTIANDGYILKAFLTLTGNIYVQNVTDRHVTEYFTQRSDLSPGTVGLHHAHLNGFFKWCRQSKRAPFNFDPMVGRKAPKVPDKERLRIPQHKFPYLLDLAGEQS